MDSFELRQRIRGLVEPTVSRLGFDLVSVEWITDQSGRALRLSIDGPKGVGADDCALISKRLSPLLDAEDPIQGKYLLEVSSPGIERPVERLDDFAKLSGFRAKIRLFEGHPRRRYTGTLGGVEDQEILVTVDGEQHRIDYDSIERANLVLDLDEYEQLPERLYGNALGESST